MNLEQAQAAIHKAHDALHTFESTGAIDDLTAAHEALHCGINEGPLDGRLGDADAAGQLAFSHAFTALCREHRVAACFVSMVPTKDGTMQSLQIGGHVITGKLVAKYMADGGAKP